MLPHIHRIYHRLPFRIMQALLCICMPSRVYRIHHPAAIDGHRTGRRIGRNGSEVVPDPQTDQLLTFLLEFELRGVAIGVLQTDPVQMP